MTITTPMNRLLCLLSLLCLSSISYAQVSSDAAVGIDATVDAAAHSITLHWKSDAATTTMSLFRRVAGAASWGTSHKLGNADSMYVDTAIEIGTEYEYRISKSTKVAGSAVSAAGYIRSGIAVRVGDGLGRCILLIDSTYLTPLKNELQRLESDLMCEGQLVTRVYVSRTDTVADIKDRLQKIYSSDPKHFATVFIFGHVPVPYSGFLNPDGHPDHFGAWPADMYYAEFDGDWTDDDYEDVTGIRLINQNITGDGKFDNVFQPDDVDLRVGRVDLYDMPAFAKSDTALMLQYLNKDHNYRIGESQAPERAIVDDAFGYFGGEAFASSGWRNFAPLVGRNNIVEIVGSDSVKRLRWLDSLSQSSHLWVYGCGGGWDQGAGGVCSTQDLGGLQSSHAVFTILFGSYFGDWNVQNNFLRAPLATSEGLTCAWSGRPYWHFFPMGMGHTTGDAALLTQNNGGDYVAHLINGASGPFMVHIALMGDPTLRMRPYTAPAMLSVTGNMALQEVNLVWEASKTFSYNVYRASVKSNIFSLLTPQPVIGGAFTDSKPLFDSAIYLVRAVKSETTASGNYLNLSYGAWGISPGGFTVGVSTSTASPTQLRVDYSMTNPIASIHLDIPTTERVAVSIVDITGKTLTELSNTLLPSGEHDFEWNYETAANGLYFVRAITPSGVLTEKILVRK